MNSEIIIYSAPGCTFCHAMINSLEQLKSSEKISSFDIIDISQQPEEAEKLSIRSVPFIIIKKKIFIGSMTTSEIAHWYSKEDDDQGHSDYFNWQLNKGEIIAAESTLKLNPQRLNNAIQLLLDSNTQLSVRIGLMALIESFEGSNQLQKALPLIEQSMTHEDHRIRTDITELLLLSQHRNAEQLLKQMQNDDHQEVSNAAKEALNDLLDVFSSSNNTQH